MNETTNASTCFKKNALRYATLSAGGGVDILTLVSLSFSVDPVPDDAGVFAAVLADFLVERLGVAGVGV